jgi:hypothetical protein
MIQEPRRLAARYFRTNLIFAVLLLRAFFVQLTTGARHVKAISE